MRSTARAMVWSLGALALALALALGCGGDTREEKLQEARERVNAAEERLAAAESRQEERRKELEEARQSFEAAQEKVAEARAELQKARRETATHASDALLFRSVQRRLLEDGELESVAVSASVEDGVVTLEGEVPSKAVRDRAVQVAKETAGVTEVVSRIRVAEESGEGD